MGNHTFSEYELNKIKRGNRIAGHTLYFQILLRDYLKEKFKAEIEQSQQIYKKKEDFKQWLKNKN